MRCTVANSARLPRLVSKWLVNHGATTVKMVGADLIWRSRELSSPYAYSLYRSIQAQGLNS